MALTNRSTFRKALAVFIDDNANFKVVFDYIPDLDTVKGRTPVCFVRSAGTDQTMLSLHTNPSDFHMLVTIAVRSHDRDLDGGTWEEDDAEDKIDELDQIIRQIIRDNTGNVGGVSMMQISGLSDSGFDIVGGIPYRVEEYTIIGHNPAGE